MKKILLFLFIFLFGTSQAVAMVIRDSEMENFIKEITSPIIKVSKQDIKNQKIIILGDNAINAFVTPDHKIFIFTGLILKATHPNQIEGVLAHEMGHITGRHHIKIYRQLEKARIVNIAGLLLGGAATVLTGDPNALATIAAGTQTTTERALLSFSRIQEGAADQAAFSFLKQSKKSICGIISFLEFLASRELIDFQNPYTRSHPLTKERINDARNAAKNENCEEFKGSINHIDKLKYIQAKLNGFMNPKQTIETVGSLKYFNDDHKKYALAIANYKLFNLKEGNDLIDQLIQKYPNNPYFYELKAQMLRENGNLNSALENYLKAIKVAPNDSLILIELAQTQINFNSHNYSFQAIQNLKKASLNENENQKLWYLLSVAYGRNREMGKSRYASAYSEYLKGNDGSALNFIRMAKKITKKNSVDWYKIEDLENRIKEKIKK